MKINNLLKFKKAFTLGFFALAFFIFGLGLGKEASAAIYNIGPGQTYTTFSALTAAISLEPGDIVDGGGNIFNDTWTINGNGTIDNYITVRNATINGGDSLATGINTNSKNYINITNINISNIAFKSISISGSSYVNIERCGISGKGTVYGSSSSHIVISDFTSTNTVSAYGAALYFVAPGTDLNVNSATITNSTTRGIYSSFTSNVTLNTIEVVGGMANDGIEIRGMTSGILSLMNIYSGVTSTGVNGGNVGYGVYISGCNGVLLSADGVYIKNNTGPSGHGIFIESSSLLSGSFITNFDISHNTQYGIWVKNSSNLIISSGSSNYNSIGIEAQGSGTINLTTSRVSAQYNRVDGMAAHDGVTGWIVKYSDSKYNGTTGEASTGDGFSIHDTCTANYYYVQATDNKNTGMAHTVMSGGSIYNSLILNNGSPHDETMQTRAGLFITTVADPGFAIKNNIISSNYPITLRETLNSHHNDLNFNLHNPLDNNNFHGWEGNDAYMSWADYHPAYESYSLNAEPLFISSSNFTLQYNSPAIDAGTNVGLTADYAGNPIYGTPDIGAYEYQPPHLIGTDKIDIGAGARIYGDGKFRDKETTNSNLADLTIAPESGDFETYESDEVRPEWMDIKNITWEDTKEWTESSINSSLTNTLHTVGDLTPNNYYNVSVDNVLGQNITGTNCTAGICKADSNGKIAFTYTGTYSEHTFKVQAGDNSNPTLTNNTENKFSTETTSVNLSLTTDENSTCRYSNNSSTTYDSATAFTTTGETNHTSELTNLTSGNYLYYAICRDSNNNESSYTLTFEIAPEELKSDVSSPIIKTSEGKEKMKNSTIYSDSKEIKLQGEDIKLGSGSVKIYQNSKKIKTIQADEQGKWNGKVKLSNDFSGYLKVKLYNQYGTLIGEKKTKVKVDNEKPEFTSFPKNQTLLTRGKTKLNFLAEDNNRVTEYKIYLGGKIYKTKTNSFLIPAKTELGLQYLRIRAYDKAGNSSYKETFVLVR